MAHVRTANGSVFVNAAVHPDDTTDPVNVASVLPGLEAPLDNTAFLYLQEWPVLTVTQLAAIAAPIQGLVRTVKDSSGRKLGRFQFRTGAGVDAGAVSGVSYLTASDSSGVWFSEAYAGFAVGGTNAVTNSSRSLLMPLDTPVFASARRVCVSIPLTLRQDAVDLAGGGLSSIDGTSYNYLDNLSGAQGLALIGVEAVAAGAQSAGHLFRTRLPRGSFAGASVVYRPNNTGNSPNVGIITRPLRVRVYEQATSLSLGSAPVGTYPKMYFDSAGSELKWTGSCGAVGNDATALDPTSIAPDFHGVKAFHNLSPALVNMASGTTSTTMKNTGGTTPFTVSEEREYFIHVQPPTLSGATWNIAGSARGVLFKLEVWVDVTNLGAA